MAEKSWIQPEIKSLAEELDKKNNDKKLKKRCRGDQTRFKKMKEKICRKRKGTKFS